MAVTGTALAETEANFREIERLISSELLHASESLCKLLRYLAEQSRDHPGTPLKEYQIATEVFNRPSDFDPRLDSTVRVQTGRLRSKLAEYYGGPGADDEVVVDIPKGSYTLSFHPRPHPPVVAVESAVPHTATVSPLTSLPARSTSRTLVWAMLVLSIALAGAIAAIVYLLLTRPAPVAQVTATEPTLPYRHFWKSFLNSVEPPWVVFSNAEFVGRPETGMKYFDANRDSEEHILDHYTGVGEVLGVHELDRVFNLFNRSLRIKRGRLLSFDDAKNNSIIFVGSPSENLPLRDLPSTRDFVFRRVDSHGRKGDLAIINVHPRKGEQPVYYGSPTLPLTEDYSVIALFPGMNPSRWVVLLAGTTTIGTQAAVEFVCRPQNINELLQKVNGSPETDAAPFEAVLWTKVSHGVPVQAELVAVHAK